MFVSGTVVPISRLGSTEALAPQERDRATRASLLMDESWLTDDPLHGLWQALRDAVHGPVALFDAWNGELLIGDSLPESAVARAWRLDVGDPFAQHPLGLATGTHQPDELIAALVPALARWLSTARSLGSVPFEATGLTTALDSNAAPSYLQRTDGQIVFANRAARRLEPSELRRLTEYPVHGSTQLRAARMTLRLVTLAPHPGAPAETDARIDELPPSLRRVAFGLRLGLSDKELAERLDMPLASVRTYTARVLNRLGLSSRRALMRG